MAQDGGNWQLLLLSAATEAELEAATAGLAARLEAHPDLELADVAYTLQTDRERLEHRRMLVCRDLDDARSALADGDEKRVKTRASTAGKRPVAFMFSGQGAQYPGMGRGLYETQPAFRREIDRCCERLAPLVGRDLRELLYPAEENLEAAAGELGETRITQPALFVVEWAAARLWLEWGVHPGAMIGHSIGEYAAACLAGVFTLEEALALVAARGRLMQSLPPGDMLTVPRDEEEVRSRLPLELSIATINAPGRCVVSGPAEAIEAFRERLAEEGVRARLLHTSHAFHSAMMEPILEPFVAEVRQVGLKPPRIPYVSNVTGTWITAEQATDPTYWATHLRQAVRFADGAGELLAEPRVLVEVGPGNTLVSLAQRLPQKTAEHLLLPSIRHPRSLESDDEAFLLGTLGQLWLAGVEVDWEGFHRGRRRRRLAL